MDQKRGKVEVISRHPHKHYVDWVARVRTYLTDLLSMHVIITPSISL
jgi:hypothetical protein